MSDSDSDGSISLDDASTDEEEFGDMDERTYQQQQQALAWFNQVDATNLIDTINCSQEQANTIIRCVHLERLMMCMKSSVISRPREYRRVFSRIVWN